MASFALSPSYTPSLLDPPSLPEDGIRALMLFLALLRLLIIFLLRSSIWASSLISIVGRAALLFCIIVVCHVLLLASVAFALVWWLVSFCEMLHSFSPCICLFLSFFFMKGKYYFDFPVCWHLLPSMLLFLFSLFARVFLSFLLSPFIRTMSNLKDGVVCCRKSAASCVSEAANLFSGGGGGKGLGGMGVK